MQKDIGYFESNAISVFGGRSQGPEGEGVYVEGEGVFDRNSQRISAGDDAVRDDSSPPRRLGPCFKISV